MQTSQLDRVSITEYNNFAEVQKQGALKDLMLQNANQIST